MYAKMKELGHVKGDMHWAHPLDSRYLVSLVSASVELQVYASASLLMPIFVDWFPTIFDVCPVFQG